MQLTKEDGESKSRGGVLLKARLACGHTCLFDEVQIVWKLIIQQLKGKSLVS